MSRRTRRVPLRGWAAGLAVALACLPGASPGPPARPETPALERRVSRGDGAAPGSTPSRGEGSSGWWLGTAGAALTLAACGWAAVAARRGLPRAAGPASGVRVVGRTCLSPKHSVYLLDVAGRVLVVGAGPQGAPSLLAELTDPAERARLLGRPVRGDGSCA